MPATVLDSFALITFFRGEAGGDRVAALLQRAGERDTPVHMTEVNYAEVKYMIIRKKRRRALGRDRSRFTDPAHRIPPHHSRTGRLCCGFQGAGWS